MIWIALAAFAALFLLGALASRLRFRMKHEGDAPQGAAATEVSARQEFVVRGPEGEERRFPSLDAMPEALRAEIARSQSQPIQTRIIVMRDGRREEYDSLESVPEDLRAKLAGPSDEPPKPRT